MIPDDHRYRYRYRYRYRSYADTYTDTYTETNTDTDMLRRISNRQPVCKLRYARARGNQSATSNAYKQLLGCFAGIIPSRCAFVEAVPTQMSLIRCVGLDYKVIDIF